MFLFLTGIAPWFFLFAVRTRVRVRILPGSFFAVDVLNDLNLGDLLPLAGSDVDLLRRLRPPVRDGRRTVACRAPADADADVARAHDRRRLRAPLPETFLASIAFAFVARSSLFVAFRFVALE